MAFLFRPKIYKNGVCVALGNYTIKWKDETGEHSISTGKKNKGEANEFFRQWNGRGKNRTSIIEVERAILDDLEVNQYAANTVYLYK